MSAANPRRDSLADELERFPKDAVDEVAASIDAQANCVLAACAAVGLFAVCLLVVGRFLPEPEGWQVAAALLGALTFAPLLIGAVLKLWWRGHDRRLREMAGGMYWVRWQYGPEQWAAYCARSEKNLRWILPGSILACALITLVIALALHFDNDELFFGSVASHYGACLGAGVVIGAGLGLFGRFLTGITQRLRRTLAAQTLVGPAGLYVTGQFSPFDSMGYKFKEVQQSDDDRESLTFVFRTQTKHGWRDLPAVVPIPPGQQQVALTLVQRLHSLGRE